MRAFLATVLAAWFFVLSAAPATGKAPPSAFGTDLGPEQASKQPPDADEDVMQKPKRARRPPQRVRRVGRGEKVKIRLDGDMDGGGEDVGLDPDAGDF